MIQTLIKTDNFDGKYVAMKGFDDPVVISEGANFKEAFDHALEKGFKNPVIIFVPAKGMVQIY